MNHKHFRSIWMFFALMVITAAADAAPPVATVQTLNGQIYAQRKGVKTSVEIKVRASLYVGDTVATGPKSKATLLFSNGAILRLNEKTAIEITAPVSVGKGKESLFRVLSGEIWSRWAPKFIWWSPKTAPAR